MPSCFRPFPILVALLLVAATAHAHELFLAPRDGELVLLRGHLAAGHEHGHGLAHEHGHGPEACPADILTGAAWIDARGEQQFEAAPGRNGWPADTQALLVRLSTGYWTKTPQGTVNLPPDGTDRPLTSWLSHESLKWLACGSTAWSAPLGPDEGPGVLELVPLENPFELDEGDKLTVRLVSGRRPIAGAVVTYGGKARGKTDADGRINIRLKEAGTQLLAASWIRPDPDGRCERIVTTCALQFELEER